MTKALFAAALLASVLPGSAGGLYDAESTHRGTASQAGIAVDGLKMKMDVAPSDKGWNGHMIFDGSRLETMVVNDDDRRSS